MAVLGQLTNDSTPEQVASAIIGEVQARGYTRDEAIGVVADGLQESGLRMVWDPSMRWYGYYQQDGSYPYRTDPNGNVRGFLDRLDLKRKSPGHGDIWLNIFWLQQRPSDASAQSAYDRGRKAYLTEIKSKTTQATALVDKYWSGGTAVANRPLFNEFPLWSPSSSGRGGTKVDAIFIHTQEGGGGNSAAEDLAKYLANPANQVSYHYTVSQASDGGVTVVDCVDTDKMSWSVLSANARSINLCFAGSRAGWSRDQWMKQKNAIDVAAYLVVQDCKKYGVPTNVIAPPYAGRLPGISDHRYVTKILGDGTHTDVGDGFPWDHFAERVKFWAAGGQEGTPPVTTPPASTPKPVIVGPADDQLTMRFHCLGAQTIVEALAEMRDHVLGTDDRKKTGVVMQ